MKEEKFPNIRKPSHQLVCGEFWNLGGQHNREGKKNKKQNKTHRICALITTPSGEIAQRLASATSEWGRHGLHCLGLRTSPECTEENLREQT